MENQDKGGLTNQQSIKDEFSSQSSKEDNSPSQIKPEQDQSLSHDELVKKLDTYSKTNIEENVEDYFALQRMKEKYLESIRQKEADRSKASVHYGQGVQIRLPHADYEVIKGDHIGDDQALGNNIAKEAKAYYDKNELSYLWERI
jgi:hypothetical protein